MSKQLPALLSDELTSDALTALEHNISGMYKIASAEMRDYWANYVNGYNEYVDGRLVHHKGLAERIADERNKYNAGLTDYKDDNEFNNWVLTQVQRGEGYKTMTNKLADRATQANMVAQAYINDTTPSIYALNANYEAYRLYNAFNVDFHLTDEQTVKELMAQRNHIEFLVSDGNGGYMPRWKKVNVDPVKDYNWNRREIQKALISGVLQGKSIDRLAESYLKVMGRNEAAAIRNARTSFTSAQNAGREETYHKAAEMGIDLKKEWIATLDSRTRDSHGALDGERVAYDKPFSNGLMYPAAADGAPAEVYNCRCTMRAIIPDVNDEKRETYSEWYEEKKAKQAETQKALKGSNRLGLTEAAQKATEETAETVTLKYKYVEAKTIEEAKQYAEDVLGIELEYLENANLNAINLMLKSTTEVYNIFGNLSKAGVLKGFWEYPKKVGWCGAYSSSTGYVYVKNVKAKSCISKMAKEALENFKVGWWSNGATETVFRHELGHAVQHKYLDTRALNPYGNSVEKSNKIEALRKSILDNCGIATWKNPDTPENISAAGSYLSYYGLRNTGEFVAESVAEYLTGNPRETAKQVVEILLGG